MSSITVRRRGTNIINDLYSCKVDRTEATLLKTSWHTENLLKLCLWVRFPLGALNYFHFCIFVVFRHLLRNVPNLGGKWRTKSLDTRFTLLSTCM